MKDNTRSLVQLQYEARRWISLIAVAALTATACLIGGMVTANAAEAAWVSKTTSGEHKPQRWHCRYLGICSQTRHYYCGNPTIAYTNPPPCRLAHSGYDRY